MTARVDGEPRIWFNICRTWSGLAKSPTFDSPLGCHFGGRVPPTKFSQTPVGLKPVEWVKYSGGCYVKKILKTLLCLTLLIAPRFVRAEGPSASIQDVSNPILIDGNLSDWVGPPTVLLNDKDHVVGGAGLWKGPESLSAKIWVAYDAKYLYIAADVVSQNPQFNAQRDGEIYNGDCLELYLGTDVSNPDRLSYGLTDLQIGLSPGKKGDKPEMYSFTDKAEVPGGRLATLLTKTGYTLEAAIPLEFLYKINVGPGKTLGFDVGIDDTGAGNTARSIQLAWSKSDKSWQNPSLWGSLKFSGKTVFVNTAPKINATAIQIKEMNPDAGKAKAGQSGILLWGFNKDLGGFDGKTTQGTKITSEGSGSMEVDIEGSTGWNQGLAECDTVPQAAQWDKLKAISFEVFMPAGSMAGVSYAEVFFVTSGTANSFYQSIKFKLQEGWNFVKADVDGTQFAGITKVYFIFNSGGALHGTAYVDNIRGILKGANGNLTGKVVDQAGNPVPGALVAIAKQAVQTDATGSFREALPEDDYKVEVMRDGFEVKKDFVKVLGGKENNWAVTLTGLNYQAKTAVVSADFSKKLRAFSPHYMYGNNIAPWQPVPGFKDEAALKKIRGMFDYIRVPGGGFSNRWQWRTGEVTGKGKAGFEVNWPVMTAFAKSLGPDTEYLMTLNIMTSDVPTQMAWIADARAQGIKVKYVEMGNEPDYEPDMLYQGQNHYWTVIDNYCKHYLEFAKAVRAQFPDIKIMGPTVAQLGNRQRAEGSPWLAGADAPWWDGEFLKRCGPYVDVVSLHTYPYWSNDSEYNLMTKTAVLADYVPKVKKAIAEYCPGRKIEIAVTEWNSGDENAMTAKLANGIFVADFMGQMLTQGVDQANIWDMYTQKPELGGGHGVMDPSYDPTRKFAERPSYWALWLFRKSFGDTLTVSNSSQDMLTAYASTQGAAKYILVVNKSSDSVYQTAVNVGAGKYQLELYSFGPQQYQWSENLYRAVVNAGPVYQKAGKPIQNAFNYKFKPYTITCFKLTPAP